MWIIVLKNQKYWLFRSVIHRHNDESDKCHEWHNNTISAILNAMKRYSGEDDRVFRQSSDGW